jgi:hypothetical protein
LEGKGRRKEARKFSVKFQVRLQRGQKVTAETGRKERGKPGGESGDT